MAAGVKEAAFHRRCFLVGATTPFAHLFATVLPSSQRRPDPESGKSAGLWACGAMAKFKWGARSTAGDGHDVQLSGRTPAGNGKPDRGFHNGAGA